MSGLPRVAPLMKALPPNTILTIMAVRYNVEKIGSVVYFD
jgi:hypothetical protein